MEEPTNDDATRAAEPAQDPRAGRGEVIGAVIAVLLAVIAVGVVVIGSLGDDDGGGEVVTFVVPPGTGARVERGEKVELMPALVELEVGDRLVIRNEDDRTMVVGPYTVRAREVLDQEFRRPQVLEGDCTLSGSGEVRIVVT